MFLPLMKAAWALSIREGNTSLSLEESTFAIHLYMVLQHAMGLKSTIEEGCAHLGTRATAVELKHFGILLVEKKNWTAFVKSFPTMCQQWRKKLTLKPSGPGLLFLFIEERAL